MIVILFGYATVLPAKFRPTVLRKIMFLVPFRLNRKGLYFWFGLRPSVRPTVLRKILFLIMFLKPYTGLFIHCIQKHFLPNTSSKRFMILVRSGNKLGYKRIKMLKVRTSILKSLTENNFRSMEKRRLLSVFL